MFNLKVALCMPPPPLGLDARQFNLRATHLWTFGAKRSGGGTTSASISSLSTTLPCFNAISIKILCNVNWAFQRGGKTQKWNRNNSSTKLGPDWMKEKLLSNTHFYPFISFYLTNLPPQYKKDFLWLPLDMPIESYVNTWILRHKEMISYPKEKYPNGN